MTFQLRRMIPPHKIRYFYLVNHKPINNEQEPTIELIDNIFKNELGEDIIVDKIHII